LNSEVKDRLVTGIGQYLNARSAGSAKFLVSEAYLAIDNYFTALLIDNGQKGVRNHQKKKKLIVENWNYLLQQVNVSENELNVFYDWWQKVRYSSEIPTPKQSISFFRLTDRIINTIIGFFADKCGKSFEELEEDLYAEVLGKRWLIYDDMISIIHENWQQEAELMGERGFGSKMGNKMLNPANFCDLATFTDDDVTRNIISKNDEIGHKIAKFYESFLKVVVSIQNLRTDHAFKAYSSRVVNNKVSKVEIKRIVENFGKSEEMDNVTNFMLSLRLSYQGRKMSEIAEDWSKAFSQVIDMINEGKYITEDIDSSGHIKRIIPKE
jgi:hypothetical protein